MMVMDNVLTARNMLEFKRLKNNNSVAADTVSVINTKFVRKDRNFLDEKGKPKDILMLKDVVESEEAYGKYPILREDLRKDIYSFFNTQLTNTVNRNVFGRYARMTIVDNKPHQSHIVMEDYSKDIFDLMKISREDVMLNKVMNSIKIEKDLVLPKDGEGKDEDVEFNADNFEFLTGPVVNENAMCLVYVNTFKIMYTRKSNIPKALGELHKPFIIKDIRDVFPSCSIGQLSHDDNEMIFVTDEGFFMVARTGLDSLAIRSLHPLELSSYNIFKYKLTD